MAAVKMIILRCLVTLFCVVFQCVVSSFNDALFYDNGSLNTRLFKKFRQILCSCCFFDPKQLWITRTFII